MQHIRETLGMGQEDLAKKVGLQRTSIANLEAGRQRIPMHTLEKIVAAFGMDMRHFMKGIWL